MEFDWTRGNEHLLHSFPQSEHHSLFFKSACFPPQNEMEAAEPTAAGAASASSDGGEGVARARRGPSPRQHRRLLSTVQRSSPDPKPPAPAAPAPGALHRLDGRVPLDGRGPLPERHLRPRMPPLTRRHAAVPGSSLLPGRRHWGPSSLHRIPFERRRSTGRDDRRASPLANSRSRRTREIRGGCCRRWSTRVPFTAGGRSCTREETGCRVLGIR